MEGIARGLASTGYCSVTFDLRGVNRSTGCSTFNGRAEIEDVVDVCDWCLQHLDRLRKIVLVGSSFGANLAGSSVDKIPAVIGYVGIGYLWSRWTVLIFGTEHIKDILKVEKPKMLIYGTNDIFCPKEVFDDYFDQLKHPKERLPFNGVGHFDLEHSRYDDRIIESICQFIKRISEKKSSPRKLDITDKYNKT
eukprot:GHVL01009480.1.p1 GENE.GHVL01009480.1~~GHVL01009480.1.p1  ORF type:complete len:193 (+),score=35.06 GHVL01009480.1:230-808(+)